MIISILSSIFLPPGPPGVPVAGGEHRQPLLMEELEVLVELRDDRVTVRNGKPAPGTEVVLHVDDEQRSFAFHRNPLDNDLFKPPGSMAWQRPY